MHRLNQWKFDFHGFQKEEAKSEIFLMLPVCFTRGLTELEIVHGYSHGTVLLQYFQSEFIFDCKRQGWILQELQDLNPGSSCFQIQSGPNKTESDYLTYFNVIFEHFNDTPFSFLEMVKECKFKRQDQRQSAEFYLSLMKKYDEVRILVNSEKYRLSPREFIDINEIRGKNRRNRIK